MHSLRRPLRSRSALHLAAFLLTSLVLWSAPARVRACSCSEPMGAGRFYLGAGGLLPANALGIPWSGPATLVGGRNRVTLTKRHADGREVSHPFNVVTHADVELIVPAGGLSPGEQYRVTVRAEKWQALEALQRDLPAYDLPPHTITAAVQVALDGLSLRTATLRLAARERRGITTPGTNGGCISSWMADTIALHAILPDELEPYRDYLLYETHIDRRPWRPKPNNCADRIVGRSWMATPGDDLVFQACEQHPAPGVGASTAHAVEMHIRTPDGSQKIVTPSLPFTLSCIDKPAEPPVSAGLPTPPSSIQHLSRPQPDPAPAPTPRPGGCSVHDPSYPDLLALILPLLILGARTRKPIAAA